MKKVGIVCDNYKLKEFQKALNENKLVHAVQPYSVEAKLTLITLLVNESQVSIIAAICQVLEINFKQSN